MLNSTILLSAVTGINPFVRLPRVIRVFPEGALLSRRQLKGGSTNLIVWEIFRLSTWFILLSHWGACIYVRACSTPRLS